MKKILVLLVLCCFSACAVGPSPEELLQKTQKRLAQGCEFSLELRGESEASATLRWSAEEQELCFTTPDAVEGLCYLRDGGGLTETFEGISSKISEAALPQGAAVTEIFEALDTILISDSEALDCDTETDGLLKVSTQSSPRGLPAPRNNQRTLSAAAWVDVESCLPIAVETEHWAVALALHNAL